MFLRGGGWFVRAACKEGSALVIPFDRTLGALSARGACLGKDAARQDRATEF